MFIITKDRKYYGGPKHRWVFNIDRAELMNEESARTAARILRGKMEPAPLSYRHLDITERLVRA